MIDTLNRNTPPKVSELENFEFPTPQIYTTPNNILIYQLQGENLSVIRTNIIFLNGRYSQTVPLQAQSTASLLTEATKRKTSAQVSKIVDYYGIWIQSSVSQHYTIFTLYTPVAQFKKGVSLLIEMLTEPRFSTKDLSLYARKGEQMMRLKGEKVDYISSINFNKTLFGNHPYGTFATCEDYKKLTPDTLNSFYSDSYKAENCVVVSSGDISTESIEYLSAKLTELEGGYIAKGDTAEIPKQTPNPSYIHIPKSGAMQTGVSMGGLVINRSHPSYMQLSILNTVFGGYFGSRLMKRIREELGYTYGINSWIVGLQDAAYQYISTQTAVEYTKSLIAEICNEQDKLRATAIPTDELERVKSYLRGDMARIFDNQFTIADALITMIINRVPLTYYNQKWDAIQNTTPQLLLQIAQNYLVPECQKVVVAGGDLDKFKNIEQ